MLDYVCFFCNADFQYIFVFFFLQDSQLVTSGYNGSKEHFASSCHILAHAKFNIKQY